MNTSTIREQLHHAFELTDLVRKAEHYADVDACAARCIDEGETRDGIPVVFDPVPQEHPFQRYFREGAIFAARDLLGNDDVARQLEEIR